MKKVTELDENGLKAEIFYDSISEVLKDIAALNKMSQHEIEATFSDGAFEKGADSFHYFSSFDEAVEAFKKGNWTTGIEELNTQFTIQAKSLEEKTRQKNIYDVVGYQASVPRYLQGLPQNMIASQRAKKQEKVITIVKHIGYMGFVKTEQIIQSSAKVLAILNKIEKMGIRCNLDVYSPVTVGFKTGVIRIRIKNANERLSIGKIAFPLANPEMLRRIIFYLRQYNSYVKVWNIFGTGISASLGSTINSVPENIKNLEKAGVKDCIFLNNLVDNPETELRRNGLIK